MPLSSITMKRDDLIDRIKKNRATHKAEYETAHAAWRAIFLAGLERLQGFIAQGKLGVEKEMSRLRSESPEPKSHDAEYDTALAMLEAAIEDKVVVHAHEFRQLVRDEWDWKDRWAATNELYSGAVR